MYLFKHKPLAILFGALLIFSACKKDSDPAYEPPVTEPFTTAAVKPGDTLVIKGQNFSTTLTQNAVSFNGVAGTVVSATANEIIVVVPATATSGDVTVTVHGNTTKVGTLVVAPLTLYCIKNNYSQTQTIQQLMAIDPVTGTESVVATFIDTIFYRIDDLEYLAATNEVVGLRWDAKTLITFNLTTKQVSSVQIPMPPAGNAGIMELVMDNSGNLYGLYSNFTDNFHTMHSLLKIDPKTGNNTVIKTFEFLDWWESLVYLPASNTIAGLSDDGRKLFKLNLTTKDTSSVRLPGSSVANYRELVVVNGSELYGYKGNYSDPSNAIADLTKIDVTTGQETLVTHLSTNGKIHDRMIYVAQRKEIATIWDQTGLYRFNVITGSNATISFTNSGSSITYSAMTSN
jgi:hypothetical protein